MGWLSALLALVGCDSQRIAELEEGVATEADVKARFGEPERVWEAARGAPPGRVFEYSRQPAGYQNYMITIGPDGKMAALRQVLTPENFAKATPGMLMEDLRKLLGRPMRITPYELKGQTIYDWRYRDGPNASDAQVFSAVLDSTLRVVSTSSAADPDLGPK